ncbi:MAG: GH92 family glycosyl hydrolase [Microbacterium sp.]|uniref:GH92 family glycosyl hydrolase n=1 Tax=Microbacterium sp. TaxID=51671 RepID=UPI0039E347DA
MTDCYRSAFGDRSGNAPAGAGPLTTALGDGPVASPTAALRRGFSGPLSLAYRHTGRAPGDVAVAVERGLAVGLAVDSELSYLVFPEAAGDRYAAAAVAIDLVFADGARLSEIGARDDYGTPATARAQGRSRVLVPEQWNRVVVPLAPAAGRTVSAIELSVHAPASSAPFSGWLDDVTIARIPPRTGLDPVDYVDTRRGTNSSRDYSRGNTIPATAMPNGANLLTPMTDAESEKWLYQYARANNADNRPVLQGLGLSHQPSPWMGDRNQLAVMPVLAGGAGAVPVSPAARAQPFGHDAEKAHPHEYDVRFDGGIRARMVPTMHGACFRFTSPSDIAVVVDRVAGASHFRLTDAGEIEGWVDGGTTLSAGRSRMFFVGRFDHPPADGRSFAERPTALAVTFTAGVTGVELRLASSFIGLDQARANLQETAESYDRLRDAAREAWNTRLRVVEVEGANHDQLVTLYSSLYRVNLYPNWQHEQPGGDWDAGPRYASPVLAQRPSTRTSTGAVVRSGRMAVNHGFWDTYRTVWPAYSLLYPERAAQLLDGFVQQYRDSGWIARWSSPGHADLMTGTNADVAFADAILKGVPVPDPWEVYEALLKSATVAPPSDAVGRKGGALSPFLGYVPIEVPESVSWTTENAINDAGIGNLADYLAAHPATPERRRGRLRDEAAYFRHRSRGYRNLFDRATGFLRPRDRAGAFEDAASFDPESWGGAYTETNAWTFAFHAPHDGAGLAEMYGGRAGLERRLDAYFATPELAAKPGTYPSVIHEMVEARDVRMGQFGFSNQPAHAMPYLYLYAGTPAKTQRLVREVLHRLFRGSAIGQGYPGDEDNGEMSAWYLFSALGMYPLAVGSPIYALGSPLFPRARLRLAGGQVLEVVAQNHADRNVYVQAVHLNGEPIESPWIDHRRLLAGGVLTFRMGSAPSQWGTAIVTSPPSPLLRDLASTAVVTSDDGTETGTLIDDDATTDAVFATARPTVTIRLPAATVIEMYTLTSGDRSSAPASWTFEGEADGGWIELDSRREERFAWDRQTRPFGLAVPAVPCSAYRIRFHATAGGAPASIAELELLAVGPAPRRSPE